MAVPQNEIIFSGHLNKFEQREGDGREICKGRQGFECYTGNFKRDAFNGHANYFANSIKRGLWSYQGNFRSNIIEGYGAISYGDATYFSGLFKNDKPFGPGILTHTNGRQDVGIWYGSQIYRLCITVCHIEKLTYTPQDRIQVAKFKKLVEIDEPLIDIVPALLKSIGKAQQRFDPSVLYSRFCKEPRSNLYDHKYFDLDDLQEIEMSLSAENPETNRLYNHTLATKFINTSKVELKDVKSDSEVEFEDDYNHDSNAPTKSMLRGGSQEIFVLSWNNTSNVIELMKHSFKHRRQEETSDHNIVNILCGRRKKFRTRGPKENASIKVLEASASNDVMTILKELKQHTLNLDVMDNKGNSMIITAAANDAHDVLQLLHFLGADIDTVNDEGFSALTHTLTRYIALKYDVSNWSNGFLPKDRYGGNNEEEEKWLNECMQSDYSLNRRSASLSQAQGLIPKVKKNKELSNPQNPSNVPIKEPPKSPRSEYVFELSPEPRYFVSRSDAFSPEDVFEKEKRLEVIKDTAFYLLDIGVDLDVSSTPVPIMVLAIFSGNLLIVEKLLERGADANEMHEMNNGELSALHIIAQARPLPSYPAMVNLFLRYGANPNLRTSVNYNSMEWDYLMEWVKLSQPAVAGLTPLHIIAMRSDATYVTNKQYLEQICCLLSWFGDHNELFLGLSPLGLAITKGNNNIVSTILNCAKIDVNEPFNNFWVNPLYTYLRCHGYKNDPAILDILRNLILKGANPLETGMKEHDAGNVLNFISMMRVRRSTVLDELKLSKGNNLKNHEQILLELAKLNVRKYIRGLLVRLHLKFLRSIDAEIMNFMKNLHSPAALRQVYLPLFPKLISFPTTIKYSDIDDEEEVEYGYKEICKRTKEWMNTDEECREIMEKILQKTDEVEDSGQSLRLVALLPNMSIRLKRPEMKNLKITKFLEGKCIPDLRTCPIIKNEPKESIKGEENEQQEGNLKWIKHFVNQYKSDVYVYPELDKNRSKYIVCYKCLKRTANAQPCPICRLVYFCSLKCNLADSNGPDQYHRCAVVFWNMKPKQFFLLEKKHSTLISKRSTLLARKSHRRIFSTSSDTSAKDTAASGGSSIHEGEGAEIEEIWTRRPRELKKALSEPIKWPKKQSTRKYKKKSKVKFKGRGKHRRMSKLKGKRSLGLATKRVSTEGDEVDMFGLSERDRKWDEINTKGQIEVAARLLERQSYILENRRLEAERLKEEHDIGTDLLGELASQEQFWEKDDQNVEKKRLKEHSLKNRFLAFLKMLQDQFGGFDLEKYLPYIVFVDGVMYYKFYGTKTKYRENYSFN